jgi:hypothetical protein
MEAAVSIVESSTRALTAMLLERHEGLKMAQSKCHHKRSDGAWCTVNHTFPNGTTAWLQCMRCGKTWKNSQPGEHEPPAPAADGSDLETEFKPTVGYTITMGVDNSRVPMILSSQIKEPVMGVLETERRIKDAE